MVDRIIYKGLTPFLQKWKDPEKEKGRVLFFRF